MTRPPALSRDGLAPRLQGDFLQAVALLQAGRAFEAAARLASLAASAPGEPEVRRALAEALRVAGDLPGAEREARAAVAADRRSVLALHTQAVVLQSAGRPGEAEKAWRAALGLDRRFAPAAVALNRLLVAQGRAREAAQATAALAAAGSDAELLAAHAEALKAQGRLVEARDAFRRARDAAPASAVGWHNLAAAHADLREDVEALAAVDHALALGLDSLEPWLVRAHALQGLARYDEAEAAYAQALRHRPDDPTTVADLAQLRWMRTGDLATALEPYASAQRAGGPSHRLAISKARLQEFAGDLAGAAASLEPAAAGSDRTAAVASAALACRVDPSEGARRIQAAAARFGDDVQLRFMLAEARLGQGRAREADALLDAVLAQKPLDQSALAVRAAAWRALGDPRLAELYDYGRMVGAYTLAAPPGWLDLAAYLADLKAALERLHGLRAHPVGQSLRGGAQTSTELRRSQDPALRAFFAAIDAPIREHAAGLGRGKDPLRARNTGRHALAGAWSVRLRPGEGRHVAHIHPEGWLSSAFYVDVPAAVDGGGREGWLGFGEPGLQVAGGPWPPQHWVKPQPGRLVLFPSYMWHGTEPFGGDTPRLTMAFDVVPRVTERPPLAVFDVDGTLVDSRESIGRTMARAFEAADRPPPSYDATRRIVGLSLPEAVRTLAPDVGDAQQARLVEAYREAWAEVHAQPGFREPLYSGAAELLAHLAVRGWRLAMATGKGRRGVDAVVRMHGWEGVFASTHCADDGPGKPDPAMLHAALAAAGAAPGEAVMVGDTAFDMRMARAAGVRALGVGWGFHTAEEVAAGGADHVSSDFRDLEAELDRFAASKRAVPAPI